MRKMGMMGALELRECDKKAIRVLALVIAVCVGVFCLSGCQKVDLGAYDGAPDDDEDTEATESLPTKKFTFTVKGDWSAPVVVDLASKGYLAADDKNMTDLWVLDYMGGELVQQLHQVSTDSDWGVPQMQLSYGSHHVYFIASRGVTPVLDTDAHTITWGSVRDTFWKDYEVEVVATSNGNRAVTLDRAVTRLHLTVTDEVPAGIDRVVITPATWYSCFNYATGEPVATTVSPITVSVPASYVGTTGQLIVNTYSFSGVDTWNTDVDVAAYDGNDLMLGSASITAAPMKRNRSTNFSGPLFGTDGNIDVSLNGVWDTAYEGTW